MHSTTAFTPLRTLGLAILVALIQLGPGPVAAQSTNAPGPCVPAATAQATLNVNTASESELQRLPRIGPARAQAILRTRAHLGGFKRVSQLLRVKGIGRATLRELLPLIRLTDPPAPVEAGEASPDPVGLEGS